MNNYNKLTRFTYAAILVLLLVSPFLGLYPVFVMKLLCFALFACAFNLLLGFTGLLSFGHAAFFGFAAYVTFFLCLQAPFTGGEDGLQSVPRGELFSLLPLASDISMYYFVVAVVVACFLGISRIVKSPFGQVLKMIRENEPRAISLGYNVDRYKLLAFVLSAGLTGLAGSLKTLVMGFATLSDVHWSMSGEVILMTLLGGVGTLFGPVFGAGIVIALQNLLADKVGSWVSVIIGVIFVLCVLAFRKGVVGELQAYLERRRHSAAEPDA